MWSTKNREPLLVDGKKDIVCRHITKNAKDKGIYIDRINGYTEHLHALMLLNNEYSLSKQMQLIKGESSYWINNTGLISRKFEWADKYFAASVSDDKLDKVRGYISIQEEHHKKLTFQEECKFFLNSLGFDEHFG